MPTQIDLQQMFQQDPELREAIANVTTDDPNEAVSQLKNNEHKKVTDAIRNSTANLSNAIPSLPSVPNVPQIPNAGQATTKGLNRLKQLLPNPANFIVVPTFFGSDLVASAVGAAVKKATDSASKAAEQAGEAAKKASEKAESRIDKATKILTTAELQSQVSEIRGTVASSGSSGL